MIKRNKQIYSLRTRVNDKDFLAELTEPEWLDVVSAGGMHIGHGRTKRFVELNENQVSTNSAP